MSDPNVVVARNTDKAPVSDLYSQTVAFSHYNNLSAQLPIDPATGAIVAGGARPSRPSSASRTCRLSWRASATT